MTATLFNSSSSVFSVDEAGVIMSDVDEDEDLGDGVDDVVQLDARCGATQKAEAIPFGAGYCVDPSRLMIAAMRFG